MTAERIALISDYEGNVAALQAALRALKQDAPDSIVLAGDIIASHFRPTHLRKRSRCCDPSPCRRFQATPTGISSTGAHPLAAHAVDATAPLGSGRQLARREPKR